MAVFVTESFTAANGTAVTSLAGWVEHPARTAGELTIQSNRAYASASDPLVYHVNTPASADYSVEATLHVVSLPSSQRSGPVGRLSQADETYYEFVYMTNGARWRLSRIVAGSLLEIGSFSQALTVGNSYVAKLEMVGTTIKGYVDGVERVAVDDSAAAITAAGKVGYKHGGVAVTTTTGLHVDALTATDSAPPDVPITYVGVGTSVTTATSGVLTPGLPSGLAVDDLLIVVGFNKATTSVSVSSGWTLVGGGTGAGRSKIWSRFYQAGDAAPAVTVTTATGAIAQVAAFRGVDKTATVGVVGSVATATGAVNIGPIPGITPAASGEAVIVFGGRHDDWTSVATLTGDGLTWSEIAEPVSVASPAIGLVWDYTILPGDPVAITDKTFAVTGGSGDSQGLMFSLRPGTTVPPPATGLGKVKLSGAFTAGKPVKRKASGAFATKPAKVIGYLPPPPPPPPSEGEPVVLATVEETDEAMPLTFSSSTPNVGVIFPVAEIDAEQPLSYIPHLPPDIEGGMKMLMWGGIENLLAASEADMDTLYDYGVDGFHLSLDRMPQLGGGVAEQNTRLALAKDFANTHPQFKVTIGTHMSNPLRNFTPWVPWTDDAAWEDIVLPQIQVRAQAVDDSALAGMGFDGEDYLHVNDGWRISNYWTNPPSAASEAAQRAQVKQRARSVADAITAVTGAIDIYEYFLYLKGSAKESLVMATPPNKPFDDYLAEDWIDGMTSNSQVSFYHLDAAYYKPGRADGGGRGYDGAYAQDHAVYDASPKLNKPNSFHCPFIWITAGPRARDNSQPCAATNSCSDRAYPVSEVTIQLQKARQYTQGGEFALYAHGGHVDPPTEYAPYAAAMRSAST